MKKYTVKIGYDNMKSIRLFQSLTFKQVNVVVVVYPIP